MPEDFEDFKERVRAERSVREQRDAAERRIPGERLRREIREAFADPPDGRSEGDNQGREANNPSDGSAR